MKCVFIKILNSLKIFSTVSQYTIKGIFMIYLINQWESNLQEMMLGKLLAKKCMFYVYVLYVTFYRVYQQVKALN